MNEQERNKAFYEAVIDACVVSWVYKKEHEEDPKKALNDLICQSNLECLDPAVSKEAQALIDKGGFGLISEVKRIADSLEKLLELSRTSGV